MEQNCTICDKPAPKSCSSCLSVAYCSMEHQKKHWKIHKKECRIYRIVDDPELGKGFVATRDTKEGTIILEEAPAIFSSSWDSLSCITCGLILPWEELQRCSTCEWPVCSLECAKLGIHADNECKLFASKSMGTITPFMAFLPRGDLMSEFIRLIRACCLKKTNPELYQQMTALCSEFSLPGVDAVRQERLDVMMPLLKTLDLGLDDMEIQKLHRIFAINCHGAADNFGGISWSTTCLYVKASRVNHSCVPNCTWVVSQRPEFKIRIRTAVAVRKGEPLTIAYTALDTLCGTKDRQEKMLKVGFRCKCARCVDPTELGTYTSAICCSRCQTKGHSSLGYFLPENPLDLSDNACWKCNSCGTIKFASEILTPVETLWKAVSTKFRKRAISDCNSLVEDCKSLVKKYSGKQLHPNHWVIQNAKRAVSFSPLPRFPFPLDVAMSKYVIECGLQLLVIEDVLSPGVSYHRSRLQYTIGGSLRTQGEYLLEDRKYHEVITDLQQCIALQREALKYFEGEFTREDGTNPDVVALKASICCAWEDLECVIAMSFENYM